MNQIKRIYNGLFRKYGPQGWWPIVDVKKSSSVYGLGAPRNPADVFEICTGAILTQNTAWKNVEKALLNLKNFRCMSPEKINAMSIEKLGNAIRPAGYFNQKAKKLMLFSEFYITLEGRTPTREELLSVWGIGSETADSMLLYAYNVPVFVVDTYTRRIFSHLGIVDKGATYDEIQSLFMENLEHDQRLFNEYHALIVEHAKRHYQKRPYGTDCFLKEKIV